MLRVLYTTSECAPWIKTGGLGDVAAALPAALRDLGVDVRILLPLYPAVASAARSHPVAVLAPEGPWPAATLHEATLPTGVSALLIECPPLYQRSGGPYQDASGHDFDDNARRFGFLGSCAARLAGPASPIANWRPDVLHCNDWQSGLAPAFLHFAVGRRAATVMTIHNLAFQGSFAGNLCAALGLPPSAYAIDGVEFHGQTSFLKAGIYYADAITTVSPTYAREIQRAPLGFGLEGLLAARAESITGILNGIDVEAWNPSADPALAVAYDAGSLEQKARNKAALQYELGLELLPDAALLGMVSRLTWQKGADLVAQLIPRMNDRPVQFAIVGRGDAENEAALTTLRRAHRGRVGVAIRFDEALAHRVEAGADAFLMPSRFEPCGLNQMYSQRYGTPPIAHATGGLADSIVDVTARTLADGTASGFLFPEPTIDALHAAVLRMQEAFDTPDVWGPIQRAGMARDFSWAAGAAAYAALYARVAAARSARG